VLRAGELMAPCPVCCRPWSWFGTDTLVIKTMSYSELLAALGVVLPGSPLYSGHAPCHPARGVPADSTAPLLGPHTGAAGSSWLVWAPSLCASVCTEATAALYAGDLSNGRVLRLDVCGVPWPSQMAGIAIISSDQASFATGRCWTTSSPSPSASRTCLSPSATYTVAINSFLNLVTTSGTVGGGPAEHHHCERHWGLHL